MILNQEYIEFIVKFALNEDIASGDLTANLIPAEKTAIAQIITREDAIFCGQQFVNEAFLKLDKNTQIQWFANDGDHIKANQILCEIQGNARCLLTAERTALNFLQTLSGTATYTHSFVNLISGTQSVILDTRKTIPLLRLAQKYAVGIGGGQNQRIGLYDGILIKENHIASAGSIQAVLNQAFTMAKNLDRVVSIQIEVESLDELQQALDAGATLILLDNFDLNMMRQAVELTGNQAILEASGGVNQQTVRDIAETGVHRISVGELTKNIKAIDLSMRFYN